ncbi:MAG: tetratricopeptide repeat protein [Firmicutes bacterium]|nr:tetratricopeptide repeat protein [Bacillota bacterium]
MKKALMFLAVLAGACLLFCGCQGAGNDMAKGNADLMSKNYDSAIANYTKVIQADPKNAEAYFQRAKAYNFKDEVEKAKADFKKVVELSPDSEQGKKAKQMLNKLSSGGP